MNLTAQAEEKHPCRAYRFIEHCVESFLDRQCVHLFIFYVILITCFEYAGNDTVLTWMVISIDGCHVKNTLALAFTHYDSSVSTFFTPFASPISNCRYQSSCKMYQFDGTLSNISCFDTHSSHHKASLPVDTSVRINVPKFTISVLSIESDEIAWSKDVAWFFWLYGQTHHSIARTYCKGVLYGHSITLESHVADRSASRNKAPWLHYYSIIVMIVGELCDLVENGNNKPCEGKLWKLERSLFSLFR